MFFQNTVVREFGVPREHGARCVEIFVANAEKAGLIRNATNGKWLAVEALPAPIAQNDTETPLVDDVPSNGDADVETAMPKATRFDTASIPRSEAPPAKKAIFVGHGKNKRPLEQLKQILDHYHIPYRVATDEANHFRPISEKVADTMKECGAAILIFSADEQMKDMQDRPIFRPSENVVHELGAASVLYGGRIIIFKEDSIQLPTNFSGIGYISFPTDNLASKAHDLFKELVDFKLIQISVGN
jgi:predicted nucleotide-binding protein